MPERNLLDELMKLLNQPGPINWPLASQLADHLSGSPQPIDPWLADEYLQIARFAQLQLRQVAGVSSDPMTGVILVDRRGWTENNLRSFGYLVEPLAEKLGARSDPGPMDAVLKPLVPALLGMQVGAMVGMMSGDLLGLFDTGLPSVDPAGLTFLVPNIEEFASGNGLDPRQVRLWVALHEVAHHSLISRAWVSPHVTGIFADLVGSMELDPEAMAGWREIMADPAQLEAGLARGDGLANLAGRLPDDANLAAFRHFSAMVEGTGSYLVDRASPGLLSDLPTIRSAVSERLQGKSTQLQGMIGIESPESAAGMYGPAAAFCAEVEERWGGGSMHRMWERPENLPRPEEVQDATGWAARVLLEDPFA